MCAWRVDQMVDHLNVSYLYKKRGVYYFSKHVPQDLLSYYDRRRIVFSLKTKPLNLFSIINTESGTTPID